jgi:hypothetical protein
MLHEEANDFLHEYTNATWVMKQGLNGFPLSTYTSFSFANKFP